MEQGTECSSPLHPSIVPSPPPSPPTSASVAGSGSHPSPVPSLEVASSMSEPSGGSLQEDGNGGGSIGEEFDEGNVSPRDDIDPTD